MGNVTFTEPTPNRDRPTASVNNTLHFETRAQPTDVTGRMVEGRANPSSGLCVNGVCGAQSVVLLAQDAPLTGKAYCQNRSGHIEWNYYEQLVAHEVGHPLGFENTNTDADSHRGISIMDGVSYHLRNNTITECDKRALAQAYPTPTPTPILTCVDADGDGSCSGVDCNDSNPNETVCNRPTHNEPYYTGPSYTCYNVYAERTTWTCVDGKCSDPKTEYLYVYSYCTSN